MDRFKQSTRITAKNEPETYAHIVAVYEQFRPLFKAKNIPMPPLENFYIDSEISLTRSAVAESNGVFIQPRIIKALKERTEGYTPDMFRGTIAHELWHQYEHHFVFVYPFAFFLNGDTLKRECAATHATGYFGYGPANLARPLLGGTRNSKVHPKIEESAAMFTNEALMKIPPGDVTFVAPIVFFGDVPLQCEIDSISPQFQHLEKAARSAPTR